MVGVVFKMALKVSPSHQVFVWNECANSKTGSKSEIYLS